MQADSFPQNEIARNRISGEKSEFDNNSATNTFGFGLQVVPLHDWKSDESDGASIPDGGLGTIVDFIKNSTDTSKKTALVQWEIMCSSCYMADKHNTAHALCRYNSAGGNKNYLIYLDWINDKY